MVGSYSACERRKIRRQFYSENLKEGRKEGRRQLGRHRHKWEGTVTMTLKEMVQLSMCLTKYHAMKAHWGSGDIAPRILTSTDGGEWSASRPGRFTPGKEPRYLSDRRLGGPEVQNRV